MRCPLTARGQSSIIGVAVLVTVTVLSIAALTASAGTFVADSAAAANTQQVADDLVDVGEGKRTTTVAFSQGTLRVEPRTVRVVGDGQIVAEVDADVLVYESRNRRVASLGGVIVDGRPGRAVVRGSSPAVVGEERLLVDIVALNASGITAVGGSAPVSVTVRTNATHEYRALEPERYAVAVETATPSAWERAFEAAGLAHERRDFDGDGVPSVVGESPTSLPLDLAVSDLRAVISRG